jgi:hypothetical protein
MRSFNLEAAECRHREVYFWPHVGAVGMKLNQMWEAAF